MVNYSEKPELQYHIQLGKGDVGRFLSLFLFAAAA